MNCSVLDCEKPVQARGWCAKHLARWYRTGSLTATLIYGDDDSRFMSKVDTTAGCWVWRGDLTPDGYGRFWARGKNVAAHRWSYEHFVGPIPEGLQIDHLCCVRRCVNPAHLEAVTCRENLHRGDTLNARNARKTHCKHGHEFTEANTLINSDGERVCRACRRRRKAVA